MKKLLTILLMSASTWVWAQAITVTVTQPVGSGTDIQARLLMKRYDELHNTVSTVVNRPGADGAIGVTHFLGLPNSTVNILIPSSGHVIGLAPETFDKLTPVVELSQQPFVLIVRRDLQANNWAEYVALAKKQPVNVGINARPMMMPVLTAIESKAGIRTNVINYTTARADLDVASGNLDSFWAIPSALLGSGIEDRVKVIVTTDRNSETGAHFLQQGVFVAKDMPEQTKTLLNQRFTEILRSEYGRENFGRRGQRPMGGPVDQFAQTIRSYHQSWTRLNASAVDAKK